MNDAIDITASQRKTVLSLLERHLPDAKVWVYGSRANWTAKPESDLDMVVFTAPEQSWRVFELKEALEESSLPFRVDLFVWDDILDSFKANISKEHVVLQAATEEAQLPLRAGWTRATLADIARLKNGKGLKNRLYCDDGAYPVWGANGAIARTNELLNDGSVVVIGRVGAYCGSVHAAFGSNWVTDNAIVATPQEGNDFRFLYYLLKSLNLERAATGSAQLLVTQSGLKVLSCLRPPLEEQKAIFTPWFAREEGVGNVDTVDEIDARSRND